MDNNLKENLKNLIEELFSKMDLEVKIDIDDSQAEFLVVNIQSDEAGLLIGQGGENLLAFQHICRIIANKKLGSEPLNFIVDVNNYKENRLTLLKEMAISFARQVTSEGRPKILEPMPSYERRIIHMALKEFDGIKTESQGEGQLRRVVIKPGSDVI
jgi:spoIIIJ-associated protein